ncbi:MAG: putative zinc-binding peptidase [Dehalococcoidia bacterium]
MKLFECQACGQLLNFENNYCERCGRTLGFIPAQMELVALDSVGFEAWAPFGTSGEHFRFCANDQHQVCNWMLSVDSGFDYCPACRLNRTIPDLSHPEHIVYWRNLEIGKRRLIYGLMRLGLPLTPKVEQPDVGLAFDFLGPDGSTMTGKPVMTGHARGLITINIREADDVQREQFRANLAEPYRTVLGHFRHEVGHYYWERLVEDSPTIEPFRSIFGDERMDYAAAIDAHYARNDFAPTWPNVHVSAYAAVHPWEDWAETWAHYLHMLDTLETAYWYGLGITPRVEGGDGITTLADVDPYEVGDFDELARVWFPVVNAGNSLNRSMGQPDLYPFILTPPVLDKLRFVHQVARGEGLG